MNNINSIQCLLDKYSPRQHTHAFNTAKIAYAMGQDIHASAEDKNTLYFSGLLLDSGKVLIEELRKNKLPFNDKCPTQYSAIIASSLAGFELVAKCLSQVSENYDGSGLPKKLKEREIDTLAKVVRISAFYDDLRLNGMTHDEACNKLKMQAEKIFPITIITPFIKSLTKNELHEDYIVEMDNADIAKLM